MAYPYSSFYAAPSGFRVLRPQPMHRSVGLSPQVFQGQPIYPEMEQEPLRFESSRVISLSRAASLFIGGFALAFVGKATASRWLKPAQTVAKEGLPHHESQTFLFFQNPLSSLLMTAIGQPQLSGALSLYGLATAAGYLGSNLMRGLQETWVRREETAIRAGLLGRMGQVFQQSIQTKQHSDSQLRAQAESRIRQLLQQHRIADVEGMLAPSLPAESPETQRRYFYEPTHRTVGMSVYFGQGASSDQTLEAIESTLPLARWLDGLFVVSGVALGLMAQGIGKVVKDFQSLLAKHQDQLGDAARKVVKNVSLNDAEALAYLRRPSLILAYGAMAGVVGAAKLFFDGLREIEVTRVNAATEYWYQRHNWIALDPTFHRIAEQEALNESLAQLGQALPRLRHRPDLIHRQVQTILANVGRNSAPKYFPMTPPVGLVDARS